MDLLHRSYRKLCHLLADMDEWTQISVLNVLTRSGLKRLRWKVNKV